MIMLHKDVRGVVSTVISARRSNWATQMISGLEYDAIGKSINAYSYVPMYPMFESGSKYVSLCRGNLFNFDLHLINLSYKFLFACI